MAANTNKADSPWATAFNLPNQLTILRLILSVIMFGFISQGHYLTSMVLFIIAAGTDLLDGYFARKYDMVTALGRILDPFADKVIVLGTFIFLAAEPAMARDQWCGVKAWMVVVIMGRELLVTALRSFMEERGADFSAKMAGKLKMVFQCIAAGAGLYYLSCTNPGEYGADYMDVPLWVRCILAGSIWTAVVLTVYSGVGYILAAIKLARR